MTTNSVEIKLLILTTTILIFSFCSNQQPERNTIVSIHENQFFINERPTYQGRYWLGNKIEGLLMNARMVQGIFDDLNPATAVNWKYPDTETWDAERNTDEFINSMDDWKSYGLLSFTINMQGGSPMGYGNKDWYNSAYFEDGRLRQEYMNRLERILDKADELLMIPILGLFYFGQDQYLKNDSAVINATNNTIDWLFKKGYKNVLIEVANECNNKKYDREILKTDRIHELINLIKSKEKRGYRYLVSTSYNGGSIPRPNVVKSVDYILVHGNGVDEPNQIAEMVEEIKQVEGHKPMPVIFNEDDHFDFNSKTNNFFVAVQSYSSWGYFDYRKNGEPFEAGYQSIPVDWGINHQRKKDYFKKLKEITGY